MRSVFLGIFLSSAIVVSGQTLKPKVPRAPDGKPDLQGTWDFAQLTPLQRPSEFADKESITDYRSHHGGRGHVRARPGALLESVPFRERRLRIHQGDGKPARINHLQS